MRIWRPPVEDSITRALDLIAAVGLLLFFLPLAIAFCVLIRVEDGGPVLHVQERMGRRGRRFRSLRFRVAALDADARLDHLLAHDPRARFEWARRRRLEVDPRLTRVGTFLRKSNLDKLPELLNVVRGEMSLVGPRPISIAETVRYGVHIRHYYAVRPGLTGMWRVRGASDLSHRRRVVMDVAYGRAHGLALNVDILVKTVPTLMQSRAAY